MKTTSSGRKQVCTMDFAHALAKLILQAEENGKGVADVRGLTLAYTASVLCADKNSIVRLSAKSLQKFINENIVVLLDIIAKAIERVYPEETAKIRAERLKEV